MARYQTTEQTEQDIFDIAVYIAKDSIRAANRTIDQIHRKCQLLAEHPRIGRPRAELSRDLRSFPVGRYLIFYRPTAYGVEVIRVLSGFRDLEVLFDG